MGWAGQGKAGAWGGQGITNFCEYLNKNYCTAIGIHFIVTSIKDVHLAKKKPIEQLHNFPHDYSISLLFLH